MKKKKIPFNDYPAIGVVFSWLGYTAIGIYSVFVEWSEEGSFYFDFFSRLFFTLFLIQLYLYLSLKISHLDSSDIVEGLKKTSLLGIIAVLLAGIVDIFFATVPFQSEVDERLIFYLGTSIFYASTMLFLLFTLVIWKRLVLFRKSKKINTLWMSFELLLLMALGYDLLALDFLSYPYPIAPVVIVLFSLLWIMHLKWVVYLSFKQKWKAIFLTLFILGCVLSLFIIASDFSVAWQYEEGLYFNFFKKVFGTSVVAFISLYGLCVIVTTFFHLPTSSVIEHKILESLNLQRLSLMKYDEDTSRKKAFRLLLDSCMSATFADAGWLEIKGEQKMLVIHKELDAFDAKKIKDRVSSKNIFNIINFNFSPRQGKETEFIGHVNHADYRSIVAYPIVIKDNQVGYVFLLSKLSRFFSKELLNLIRTFVNQVNITLENIELLKESFKNERYKGELMIARRIQKNLLPKALDVNQDFHIHGISESAHEVGGDYYDLIKVDKNKYALIIADVSGKGINAAFYVAQLKGIFQSLSGEDITPKHFMTQANKVLSKSLEKNTFITAGYFIIDTSQETVMFVRAGHCQPRIYHSREGSVEVVSSEGIGLGIIREDHFDNFFETKTIKYDKGDKLLLYTDGITEAAEMNGNRFGEERLEKTFALFATRNCKGVNEGIIETLNDFLQGLDLRDDYTLVCIEF